MQPLNIRLHLLNQLILVLLNSALNTRTEKEGIKFRAHSEHLSGIFGRPELVPELKGDLGFDAVNTGFVFLKSSLPDSSAWFGKIEDIDLLGIVRKRGKEK